MPLVSPNPGPNKHRLDTTASDENSRETERLATLDYLDAVRPEADDVLQQLVDEVRGIFGTDLCMVNLNLAHVQYFRAWSGELPAGLAAARQDPLEHSMCRYVVNSETPIVVADFLATEEFREQHWCMNYGIRFYAGTPLITSDEHAIGTLCVLSTQSVEFGQEQMRVLRGFAHAVVGRLELLAALGREQAAKEKETQRSRELRRANRRVAGILESITDEFYALDRAWRLTYLNERALGIIQRAKGEGLTREEVLGKSLWEVIPELVDSAVYHKCHEATREQKTLEFEAYSPARDGWVEVHAYPSEEGLSLYVQDITERRRAEERLTQVLRARTEFMTDVSHELRTPLTVIRGNAEVGLEIESGCAHEQILEEIVKESATMSRMIEDLLFLARSDSGSLPLNLETISVARFLEGLARRAEALAHEHGVPLGTALSGEGLLRCDAASIAQAVLTLVDNAAKYGTSDEGITLSSQTRFEQLIVEVADRGPGIAQEELPRIFERFYRGHDRAERPGSGLGLPIARTILEAHGGRIAVDSKVGEGTRMSVYLPLIDGS
jgi:PAS domain S-box-containing protein